MPQPPADAFRFGKNWQRYVADYLDPEREQIATASLRDLLEIDLRGRDFLDLGAGSGLFSLCAHRLGAQRVLSLDVDPDSTAACHKLRDSAGSPDNWEITHGSILDRDLVDRIGKAHIVYSWGVLHHTGDMYEAIANAASLVKPGGILAIAIYNRVTGRPFDSERWLKIKRAYNHASPSIQRLMAATYEASWALRHLSRGRNPWRVAADYKRSRGMAVRTDLIDWLGGYPYEYASVDEIVSFCERECELRTVKTIPVEVAGHGNNQFVFERVLSSQNKGR